MDDRDNPKSPLGAIFAWAIVGLALWFGIAFLAMEIVT